jgi:threonine/homoserine/homoserine lactone efflux protein
MLAQETLITYLVILLGFVFIPGPATLLTLARSSQSGIRVGLFTGFGIAVGDIVHTLLAVLGISAIILTSALLFSIVKYVGAAYLIYLGIKALFEKKGLTFAKTTQELTAPAAFRQGVILEVLNPKSAMFFLAFLPQFVNPEQGFVALQLITLGLLFVLMGLLSTLVVALSAGRIGAFLRRNPVLIRRQNKAVGSLYCGLGVKLALQER